jgi:hypothetical protein
MVNPLNLQRLSKTVLDRRLYSRFMFITVLTIGFGLIIPAITFYYLSMYPALVMHTFWVILLFIISALPTKNLFFEFHGVHHWIAFFFLISSTLAFSYSFIIRTGTDAIGLSQFALIYGIALLTLYFSMLYSAVAGQRRSLRASLGLNADFFSKKEKSWKNGLQGFPNFEKITRELKNGKFVLDLFDTGSFSLVVLWSCNVMEEIINASTNEIIQLDPSKRVEFRTEKGMPCRIPLQLKNLGYIQKKVQCRDEEKIDIAKLWDKVRNSIAHHNHKATFEETYGALIILISFIDEFPNTLVTYQQSLNSNMKV